MTHVEPLREGNLDAFLAMIAHAYPGMKVVTDEDRRQLKERVQRSLLEPTVSLHGCYRDDQLVGGMRFHDFSINLLGQVTQAGGIGMVAVGMLHKKEHVAKEMLSYFLRHYRERGTALTTLHPFRPDFYRRMGFGYGTKLNQYQIKPSSLPRSGSKQHVQYIDADDAPLLLACYQRVFERTHGLFARSEQYFPQIFAAPENIVVGYRRDNRILGYLIWSFKPAHPDNWLTNNILIHELVYENSEALSGLLSFLHTQADQIDRITYNTHDDSFHHLLHDPRNGSDNLVNLYHESNTQNVGIMYRVVDTPGIFNHLSAHNFGGQTCTLKFTIADSFLPDNHGSTTIRFTNGTAHVESRATPDVEVSLDVGDFSSLIMGVIPFKRLLRYGLVTISDARFVDTIQRLFLADEKPISLTRF